MIKIDNVNVDFDIYTSYTRSIKNEIIDFLTKGSFKKSHENKKRKVAIKGLSLTLEPGDRLGVFGNNGAGKTTFLRLISGVYSPTSGAISVNGKLSSLINVSQGIEQEKSGYENIVNKLLYLGFGFKDINKKIDSIIEFSDLANYIDQPVRTYSSGMQVRLAFAIATSYESDILIMDEWLSLGDVNFEKKSSKRMEDILNKAKILVLASHSKRLLEENCNKFLWLENGEVKVFSNEKIILKQYFGV